MPLAIILADSINEATSDRITTFLLPRFPKFLQAELRTHRSTSQSHYSSRAIPVTRVIERVNADPFIPQWTANQKGMSGADTLTDSQKALLTEEWLFARDSAVKAAQNLFMLGCAKQECNRVLEPWMTGACVITATDEAWKWFFNLRTAEGVQPDFRSIAQSMERIYRSCKPQVLNPGQWHIPWVEKYIDESVDLRSLLKISAARSARTSYMNHDGGFAVNKDFALHDKLIEEKHSTPLEHQAVACTQSNMHRNLKGWMHYRQHVEENIAIS